ncbi:MAG: LacI family transcriptional regulator [Caulobacter sp.]|nr:LacI family transcriptional regulator [Caulobacter sp.]
MPPRKPTPEGDTDFSRKRATINDVARLAGVSKKTVSRVINDSPSVQQETRERIEAVIKQTGYVPDPQARGLAFRRSFLIGLIYDNPNPQYVVNMQLGLLDAMRGSGFELVVHPCDRASPPLVDDIRNFIERQKLYGVVLTPSVSEDERIAEMLREIDCAYIRVASVALDAPGHMIETQDRLGGLAAARHLAELGHKSIGFISGVSTFRSSHERRSGLEEGLAEHGLTLAADHIAVGAYTFESGRDCARQLLSLPNRPTAIFAGNDEMAAGALHAARELRLSVPGDVSIVGYDDFQIASRVWPPLTTVHTPTRRIGQMAAEKLMGRETADTAPEDRLPSIVVRQSSGPPPQ